MTSERQIPAICPWPGCDGQLRYLPPTAAEKFLRAIRLLPAWRIPDRATCSSCSRKFSVDWSHGSPGRLVSDEPFPDETLPLGCAEPDCRTPLVAHDWSATIKDEQEPLAWAFIGRALCETCNPDSPIPGRIYEVSRASRVDAIHLQSKTGQNALVNKCPKCGTPRSAYTYPDSTSPGYTHCRACKSRIVEKSSLT